MVRGGAMNVSKIVEEDEDPLEQPNGADREIDPMYVSMRKEMKMGYLLGDVDGSGTEVVGKGQSTSNSSSASHSNASSFVMQSNLKIFSKAISALSRLAEDLFLEPSEEGLLIKTFNRSRSAYGKFTFQRDFFINTDTSKLDPNTRNQCRVSMRTIMAIFKQIHYNGDLAFQQAKLVLNPNADTFIVEIKLAFDGIRTIEARVLENTSGFRASVDRNTLKNVCVLSGNLLHSIMKEVRQDSEDIVISASEDGFCFRNFGKFIAERRCRTSVTLVGERCEQFSITRKTDIAISYKEFMAIVEFANRHMAFVSLYFDLPGRPFVIALEDTASYTAEFILATIEPDDEESMAGRLSGRANSQAKTSSQPPVVEKQQKVSGIRRRLAEGEKEKEEEEEEGEGEGEERVQKQKKTQKQKENRRASGDVTRLSHGVSELMDETEVDHGAEADVTERNALFDESNNSLTAQEPFDQMDHDQLQPVSEMPTYNTQDSLIDINPPAPANNWDDMDDAILDNNFLTPSIVPIKKTQTPSILRTQEEPIPAKSILLDYVPPSIPANIPETSTSKESVESMDTEDEREKRKRRRFRREFLGFKKPTQSMSQLCKDEIPLAKQSDSEGED
ncbi:hypothetical protein WR25_15103 [Diploscapter pachys]|uniref:Cell cycle checkpoint control protein n=1 Tax=Diploscapter pachys TaxID=2018661 RepID=A0A2A2LLY5_9BILA|nr:hypothetical protein WR25_15103 [Diploscapter pachys]